MTGVGKGIVEIKGRTTLVFTRPGAECSRCFEISGR